MELAGLLERAIRAEVRAEAAEKLAEKAFDMASKALIELEAMKKSTHKIEYINPIADSPGMQEFLKEGKDLPVTDDDDDYDAPAPPMKVSPFGVFAGFKARRENIEEKVASEEESQVVDPKKAHEAALWDAAVSDTDIELTEG